MIEVHIVCDSISPEGKRLTTLKLRYPKFIHGEFMTHRLFSRNASSSRAIPTRKLLEEVRGNDTMAHPVFWGKNKSGMQASEELDTPQRRDAKEIWYGAAQEAARFAERMHNLGAHKQIVNRLLEPFSHINVVVTATEWDNFFALRLTPEAQPEMRALAEAMKAAMEGSEAGLIQPGQWHLPYIDGMFSSDVADWLENHKDGHEYDKWEDIAIKVSVARCARVSYESFETGKRSTVEEDLALFERLKAQGHWSPFEHQATPDEFVNDNELRIRANKWVETAIPNGPSCPHYYGWQKPSEHANFVGWRQFRKMQPGESGTKVDTYV